MLLWSFSDRFLSIRTKHRADHLKLLSRPDLASGPPFEQLTFLLVLSFSPACHGKFFKTLIPYLALILPWILDQDHKIKLKNNLDYSGLSVKDSRDKTVHGTAPRLFVTKFNSLIDTYRNFCSMNYVVQHMS